MTMFEQVMQLCDDCNKKRTDLKWFNSNIRICKPCITKRLK